MENNGAQSFSYMFVELNKTENNIEAYIKLLHVMIKTMSHSMFVSLLYHYVIRFVQALAVNIFSAIVQLHSPFIVLRFPSLTAPAMTMKERNSSAALLPSIDSAFCFHH
jgi:hypothetical protein